LTGPKLQCNFCDKLYTNEDSLRMHVTYKCDHNPEVVKQESCNFCGFQTLGHALYLEHLAVKHSGKIACKFCGELCKDALSCCAHVQESHPNAHIVKEYFSCHLCDYGLLTPLTFNEHMASHGEFVLYIVLFLITTLSISFR
jgi:hypothetical protein